MKHVLIMIITLGMSMMVYAKDCVRTHRVCIDATPCKIISGTQVCLSQYKLDCWEYKETYSCIKPNAVNYCQPFIEKQPICWQTHSICQQTDTQFNTGCMKSTQTWRCGDPNQPTPNNTIKLDNSYTLISSDYDTKVCQDIIQQGSCQLAESICTKTSEAIPPSLIGRAIDSTMSAKPEYPLGMIIAQGFIRNTKEKTGSTILLLLGSTTDEKPETLFHVAIQKYVALVANGYTKEDMKENDSSE